MPNLLSFFVKRKRAKQKRASDAEKERVRANKQYAKDKAREAKQQKKFRKGVTKAFINRYGYSNKKAKKATKRVFL